MDKLRQYVIPLKGIKDGIHFFDLTVEKEFFDKYGREDEAVDGKVNIKLEVHKSALLTQLKINLQGYIITLCDRCLDEFELPLEARYELYVKYSDNEHEDDEHIIYLSTDDHEFDISPYLYEFIVLSLPIKKYTLWRMESLLAMRK